MIAGEIGIGDVFVARNKGLSGYLIRLGAALRGQPNLGNHVAVMHHYDSNGVPWGLEGKPGGVGWADMRRYISSPYTVDNGRQPRTDKQRVSIALTMEKMIGTEYDWPAIASDALASFGIPDLFARNWKRNGTPGHFVCSSYAAWVYQINSIPHPHPGKERFVTPGDWADFIIRNAKSWSVPNGK